MQITSSHNSFSSIQAFQAHFRNNDRLDVPANQSLEIQNIAVILPHEEEHELPVEDPVQKIVLFINKMLAPLAKKAWIEFSEKHGLANYTTALGENLLSISFSEKFTLKTLPGPIFTRLTDLFRLMVYSRIEEISFAPNQNLTILGLTEEEFHQNTPLDEKVSLIISARMPKTFTCRLTLQKEQRCLLETGEWSYGNSQVERLLTITSPDGMNLFLFPKIVSFSVTEFRSILQEKGKLKVMPGQTLIIEGSEFNQLAKDYEVTAPFFSGGFSAFALDQIFLPLGKIIDIDSKAPVTTSSNKAGLELNSTESFTLVAKRGDLSVILSSLGQSLIQMRKPSLRLEPNQALEICGITQREGRKLGSLLESRTDNKASLLRTVNQLLQRESPIGFAWHLSSEIEDITWRVELLSKKEPKEYVLVLRIPVAATLSLERASWDVLITTLLKASSPKLLEGILEMDASSLMFFLFKAFFYYCCDDSRDFLSETPPNFFKESTQTLIQQLLQDKTLKDNLNRIKDTQELNVQLSQILASTPEEFDALDNALLPDPLKNVVTALKKVVFEEMQGSDFLQHCLQYIRKGVENGTIPRELVEEKRKT